jgi:hypothetical protein
LRAAVARRAVGENLGRGLGFVSITEGAESALAADRLAEEVIGAPDAIGGDDHPAADNRIFSQFGHAHPQDLRLKISDLRFLISDDEDSFRRIAVLKPAKSK